MKVLVATRNPGKFEEFRALLNLARTDLVSALEHPEVPEVIEDGKTFRANAEKKALAFAAATGITAIADDSGLEVEALGGAPGVWSARYAGESSDTEANNRKLLTAMRGVINRRARFRCALALAEPDGRVNVVEGTCEGRIVDFPRGTEGFGYDPLFIPDGYVLTFAELPRAEKNHISHRAKAVEAARKAWPALR